MADASMRPFNTFNFRVSLTLGQGGKKTPLCEAEFSECDGLEISLAPQTIREGGNNHRPIHLLGAVTYGQLSLKRGMTSTGSSFDLWRWFDRVLRRDAQGYRAEGTVTLLDAKGEKPTVSFTLTGCLPVKLKAPALNAKDGQIAIEEMQIAYERLSLSVPG